MKQFLTLLVLIISIVHLTGFKRIKYEKKISSTPASVSIADAGVVEGNGGQKLVEVSVIISQVKSGPVTIRYSTRNGSAAAGSDYVAVNSTLNFASGEMIKKITVPINGDIDCEPNETFEIVLSNASGAILTDSIGKVTIANDDCISSNLSMYEVRLTHTGYTSFFGTPADCPIRSNGKVVLTGLLVGSENVAADDDIRYSGTLQLEIDIDICSAMTVEDPGGGFPLCGMIVTGSGAVKTELEIYFDGRGGYVKIDNESGQFTKSVSGSCDQAQISEERTMVPNKTIASIFNGRDLPMLTNRTLRVGRYVETGSGNETVVEVLRKVR